eukprot:7258012-Alexandrium_andersonii.AAC.1
MRAPEVLREERRLWRPPLKSRAPMFLRIPSCGEGRSAHWGSWDCDLAGRLWGKMANFDQRGSGSCV